MSEYFPPTYNSSKFHCPYCKVYAMQDFLDTYMFTRKGHVLDSEIKDLKVSKCSHCSQPTFWLSEKIIYPHGQMFPPVNSDLHGDVKEVYNEAAGIAEQSSRAACALLRLAIEILLKRLGETGSINESIKNLVKKGLDSKIQQSLDIVRVTGNNAVHPGKIGPGDITDVQTLFNLINVIAEALITQPKRIQKMYDNLPEKDRQTIEKRDGKTDTIKKEK